MPQDIKGSTEQSSIKHYLQFSPVMMSEFKWLTRMDSTAAWKRLTLIQQGSSDFHILSNLSLKMGIYCRTLGHRLSRQIIIAGVSLILIGCSASVALCQTKWFSENTDKITPKKTFFWKYNIKKNLDFSAILVINYFNLKLFLFFTLFDFY